MKNFSGTWEWIAMIILVIAVVIYGFTCNSVDTNPKHRAGTYENQWDY